MSGAGRAAAEAGPELDALVDARLFGTRWVKSDYCVINGRREEIETWIPDAPWCSADDPPGGWTWGVKPRAYSTSWAAMGLVIERMAELGCRVEMYSVVYGPWTVSFVSIDGGGRYSFAEAETPMLATARAALLAAGGTGGEVEP